MRDVPAGEGVSACGGGGGGGGAAPTAAAAASGPAPGRRLRAGPGRPAGGGGPFLPLPPPGAPGQCAPHMRPRAAAVLTRLSGKCRAPQTRGRTLWARPAVRPAGPARRARGGRGPPLCMRGRRRPESCDGRRPAWRAGNRAMRRTAPGLAGGRRGSTVRSIYVIDLISTVMARSRRRPVTPQSPLRRPVTPQSPLRRPVTSAMVGQSMLGVFGRLADAGAHAGRGGLAPIVLVAVQLVSALEQFLRLYAEDIIGKTERGRTKVRVRGVKKPVDVRTARLKALAFNFQNTRQIGRMARRFRLPVLRECLAAHGGHLGSLFDARHDIVHTSGIIALDDVAAYKAVMSTIRRLLADRPRATAALLLVIGSTMDAAGRHKEARAA